MNSNILSWMQKWYKNHCDGDWEHNENIVIGTVDNPGWQVTINLERTVCENKEFKTKIIENSETDWYHCFVKNGKFEGVGDSEKLIVILESFKNWAEECGFS
jgi:hypothetical protein